MNNKDIIAKIKAEIERLKEKAERRPHTTPLEGFECMGKIKVCNELLSFLSTLESEKPVPNGLEEAATITLDEAEGVADEYTDFLAKGLIENQPRPIGGKWFIEYARKRFITGAEWQADHTPLPEDTVLFNKGVEEGKRLAEEEQADLFTIVALDAAQRAKEQMMKEAVEYEVGMHGEPIKITFDKYVQRARGIFPGDKVRIIIVKED